MHTATALNIYFLISLGPTGRTPIFSFHRFYNETRSFTANALSSVIIFTIENTENKRYCISASMELAWTRFKKSSFSKELYLFGSVCR